MGRFEVPGFAAGTAAVAEALGRVTLRGSTTVVGGRLSVPAEPAMDRYCWCRLTLQ
jgi:3-phosphoglycerate kinase